MPLLHVVSCRPSRRAAGDDTLQHGCTCCDWDSAGARAESRVAIAAQSRAASTTALVRTWAQAASRPCKAHKHPQEPCAAICLLSCVTDAAQKTASRGHHCVSSASPSSCSCCIRVRREGRAGRAGTPVPVAQCTTQIRTCILDCVSKRLTTASKREPSWRYCSCSFFFLMAFCAYILAPSMFPFSMAFLICTTKPGEVRHGDGILMASYQGISPWHMKHWHIARHAGHHSALNDPEPIQCSASCGCHAGNLSG